MKQYLLSVLTPTGATPPSPEQLAEIMQRVEAYDQGLKDAGAWVFSGGPRSQILDFQTDPEALDDLAPPIRSAMQASVVIEASSGWGRLGSSSIGSGVILKMDGEDALILTNRHVVDSDFDGKSDRRSESALMATLAKEKRPGDSVPVTVLRGGKKVELTLPMQ